MTKVEPLPQETLKPILLSMVLRSCPSAWAYMSGPTTMEIQNIGAGGEMIALLGRLHIYVHYVENIQSISTTAGTLISISFLSG